MARQRKPEVKQPTPAVKPPATKSPTPDRFATHKMFVGTWDNPATLSRLVKAGKMPAAIVWFVLWDKANAKNDCKVEWMTIMRLATITGMDRVTVRKALDHLVQIGAVEMIGERGKNVKGVPVYRVPHVERDADEQPGTGDGITSN